MSVDEPGVAVAEWVLGGKVVLRQSQESEHLDALDTEHPPLPVPFVNLTRVEVRGRSSRSALGGIIGVSFYAFVHLWPIPETYFKLNSFLMSVKAQSARSVTLTRMVYSSCNRSSAGSTASSIHLV